MSRQHATVPIGEYMIPLIGIPVRAVMDKCSKCKLEFHIKNLEFDENGDLFCGKCRKPTVNKL
jgi:hypothetical protein